MREKTEIHIRQIRHSDKIFLCQDFEEHRNSYQCNHATLSPLSKISILKHTKKSVIEAEEQCYVLQIKLKDLIRIHS